MIRSAVPELQLVRLAAERQAQKLMAQANAEDRNFPYQLPNIPDLRFERLRIARSVGEKNTIGLQRQNVFGRSQRGHDGRAASHLRQPPQNVLLDPEIVSHHVKVWLRRARNQFRG